MLARAPPASTVLSEPRKQQRSVSCDEYSYGCNPWRKASPRVDSYVGDIESATVFIQHDVSDREARSASTGGSMSSTDTHHGAVHHEPSRAPPWLPAARQVPLGPLGTALPLVDLALVVSALAGARGAKKAKTGPKHDFLRSQVKKKAVWWHLGAFWTP